MAVDAGPSQVLLVTSDGLIRDCVETILIAGGSRVVAVRSATEARQRASADSFPVIVADHRPPAVDALELLAAMRRDHPGLQRVMLLEATDRARIGDAVRECDLFACLVSPWDNDLLVLTVRRAAELARLRRDAAGAPPAPAAAGAGSDGDLARAVLRAFV